MDTFLCDMMEKRIVNEEDNSSAVRKYTQKSNEISFFVCGHDGLSRQHSVLLVSSSCITQ